VAVVQYTYTHKQYRERHRIIHRTQKYIEKHKKYIIPYLDEAQHVSGDTPPIIRGLKLHKQPLVLHTWKVVGRAVFGRYLTTSKNCTSDNLPRYYATPEAACAVLGF